MLKLDLSLVETRSRWGEGPIALFQTILSATSKNEETLRESEDRGPGREPGIGMKTAALSMTLTRLWVRIGVSWVFPPTVISS